MEGEISGFDPDEPVRGEVLVELEEEDREALVPMGWERQYPAEEALKNEMRAHLEGSHVFKDETPGKKRCPVDGTRRKHGYRKYHKADIRPQYDTLIILVDWQNSVGQGSMTIDWHAHVNQKNYDKCLGQKYSATVEAAGKVYLTVRIRVHPNRVEVNISARVQVDEYWGLPQWPFLREDIDNLIENQLQGKINEKIPEYERIAEDKINSLREVESGLALRSNNILDFIDEDLMQDAESPLWDWLVSDCELLYAEGPSRPYNLIHYDEINPQLIADALNNKDFSTTIPLVELGSIGNTVYFIKNLQLRLKTEDNQGNGSIVPGAIRIILSPSIQVVVTDAVGYFAFDGETNIFQQNRLDGSGSFSLAFSHTYQQPKIEFRGFQLRDLAVTQLGSDLTEWLRNKLNEELPSKIAEDDQLLRDIAILLNEAIADAISQSEASKTLRLLEREEFFEQRELAKLFHVEE